MTISCKTVQACYPISRPKLYEDVLDNKYGGIHKIWLTPGHIFVTVKEGKQLFTFDNKAASRSNETSFDGFLDVKEFKSPILDILTSAVSYSLVYIVETSGNIQCWKYRSEKWISVINFSVGNVNNKTIVSCCLHPSQNALYWCEKQDTRDSTAVCSIVKIQLPDDEEKIAKRDIGQPSVLISNCPACQLYPSVSGLYIVIRNDPPLVSMVLLLSSYSNKILVSIGKHKTEVKDFSSSQTIDFHKLMFKLVGFISKVNQSQQIDGFIYRQQDMCLSVVCQDGVLYNVSDSEGDMKKRQYKLPLNEHCHTGDWFEYQNVVGLHQGSKVLIFKKNIEGSSFDQSIVEGPDGTPILGLCKLSIGSMWPAFYTENNIYSLQWTNKTDKHDIEVMLRTSDFQTHAVHIALLEKKKFDEPTPDVYNELDELRQEHLANIDRDPTTKLATLMEPYLRKYWELDTVQQTYLSQVQKLPAMSSQSIEDEVLHTLSPQTLMSMTARQSWLLVLSFSYPHQVLKVLTSLMDFETDDISTSQIQRWQCILASEDTTSAVSSDVAVPLFEHICRLMILIQPLKLLQFVKLCQMINNQKVGVSAFIRKRQALQFYDRALDCLPPPKSSEDPDSAVTAYVELLMASEKPQCETTALGMYIDHGKWKDALALIQQYKGNQSLYPGLYITLFRAMAQKEVIAQFAEEMFTISPNVPCFSQMTSFMLPKEVNTAQDVFATSSDIPMHAVRNSLLKYVQKKPK